MITEEDLVDKDNLFENLVKWFEFDSVCSKDDVLKLILRLIKVSTYGFVFTKFIPENHRRLYNFLSLSVGLVCYLPQDVLKFNLF